MVVRGLNAKGRPIVPIPARGKRGLPARGATVEDEETRLMKWAKLIPKTVTVPPFPKITQVPSWKSMLARNLIAASTHTDKKEVAWLNEVEGSTFEALVIQVRKDLSSSIRCLFPALMKLNLPTQLRLDINQHELTAMKNGTSISGRQVIYLIYQWFATDEYMSTVYGLHDLTELLWMGDKPSEMQRFLQYWDNIWKILAGPDGRK